MIVGTAGHVDHGKTTLVRLLTGVDTDRLKEEKARGITTDLGFAYMPGPDGATIGFIDVPGHESLVRTMVAGAAGIDFALLVVAADEGVKPQTREHIEILRLLGLERGMVAVTKADRAGADRRAAVLPEIASSLTGTALATTAPLFVSAASGEGIEALQGRLADAARVCRRGASAGVFRLAVDRAFTLKGIGTVVAGTALSGRVAVDDAVTIMPGRIRARVRSLHVQNRSADVGSIGDRCALALVGVALDEVSRGAWMCGEAEPTEIASIDVVLQLSANEARAIGPSMPVHLHCGASDILARVNPLSAQAIAPGQSGFARIQLAAPLPLRHGDRLVLRDTSGRLTIGGGMILDPRPPTRRRRAPERLARLAALVEREPAKALAALLSAWPGMEDLTAFAADRGLTREQVDGLADRLDLVVLEGGGGTRFATTRDTAAALSEPILAYLADTHAQAPELPGIIVERLRTTLSSPLPKAAFAAIIGRLIADGLLAQRGPWLHLPGHVAQLGEEDRRIAGLMLPLIEKDRFRPPRVRDIAAALALHETRIRAASKALVREGTLVEIARDHFFLCETVVEMADIACRLTAETRGAFDAAAFRDELDNGRKVAIQILEFFDRHGLTHRTGDLRRVIKQPGALFGAARRA